MKNRTSQTTNENIYEKIIITRMNFIGLLTPKMVLGVFTT